MSKDASFPDTPDGRYFVVRGRLWRKSNPSLLPKEKALLVNRLMEARRAIAVVKGDPSMIIPARLEVDRVKQLLGERGPVWWTDGAPDLNRHLVANSPYAEWHAGLAVEQSS